MSRDLTKQIPDDDRLDSLIVLVRQVAVNVTDLKVRLEKLEKRFEQSSYDTKPIWERALADLGERRNEMQQANKETRASLKEIDRKLDKIQAEVSTSIARQDELEDRIDNIESKAS